MTPNGNVFGPAPSRRALPGKNSRGGGSNPITPKQTNYVQQLCQQKEIAPEDICGKPLPEMTGADADKVIRELRS